MSGKEKTNGSLAMAPKVITIPATSQESPRKLRVAAYAERFRAISTSIEEFKCRKANILNIRKEQESVKKRVQEVASVLVNLSAELTEWDDNVVYQMLEKVTILSREMIRVTLRNGMEIEQAVEQPKRRKFI